jgi:gamma-glutamyltranspeptidase/glutathione hydrolase
MARFLTALIVLIATVFLDAGSLPIRARGGMVVSASSKASEVGAGVMRDGGNAIDAAVATAFALAVTHPVAGNIGGGGFLVFRSASGEAVAYDFREMAPSGSSPEMFLKNGKYDADVHHNSYLSVGVPGTVAGLYLAWQDHGKLPWKRLVDPAVKLARDGFVVSVGLADSLTAALDQMKPHPASVAQFSRNGTPYEPGDILKQPDLAGTLERIARQGAPGFYEGKTALLIEADMRAHGGLITREDLRSYRAKRRTPVRGTYRGYDVLSVPPPSSGGTTLVQMLNMLETRNAIPRCRSLG